MLELILPFLTSVLPDVIKRILPAEKMSESERAALAQQLQLEIMKLDWQGVAADYADRNSARTLAAADIAKGNAFTSFLSAIVRPLWGIGTFTVVAYSVLSNYVISAPLQAIIETTLMFYFGGRVVEKITPHVAGAFGK